MGYTLIDIIFIFAFYAALILLIKKLFNSTGKRIKRGTNKIINQYVGEAGEYMASTEISKIPGYKKILNNCYIPKENNEKTEIDIIMLHETGIYVFESKNYDGWIFGNAKERYWTQVLKGKKGKAPKVKFYNPILQNKNHIKHLKEYLRTDIPIYSYIVFGNRCELKKIDNLSLNDGIYVTQRKELYIRLSSKVSSTENILSKEKIDELYFKLFETTLITEEEKEKHINSIKNNMNHTPVENNNKIIDLEKEIQKRGQR